jgi:hypothetical protein
VLPLLSLVSSGCDWINLDLFSEISNFLTFSKYVNHILHSRLAVDSEVNVANLPLIFLNLLKFRDNLKLMQNDLLQVDSQLSRKQVWTVVIVIFWDWDLW